MRTKSYLPHGVLPSALGFIMMAPSAFALPLTNGDFERGNLSGWNVFTTTNGTLGGTTFPDVVSYDTAAGGVSTNSARFRVGQQAFALGSPAGGGIYQEVSLAGNHVELWADIAVSYDSSTHFRNLDAGTFEMLFDSVVVSRVTFGTINSGTVHRGRLLASLPMTSGLHEIRFRISRNFVSTAATPAPLQYIDNVGVSVTEMPEPASMVLFGTGCAALAAWKWRKRASSCA